MQVIWSDLADSRRAEIIEFIMIDNVDAAVKMDILFDEADDRLSNYPECGRKGRIFGTKELVVHPNYILIYRLHNNRVEILTVVHSAQEYPPHEITLGFPE